jgi:hypothetical protein
VTRQLTGTLAEINQALHDRQAKGLSTDVETFSARPLWDERVGLFLRLTIHLIDGDSFDVDTLEASDILRNAEIVSRQLH